MTAHHVVLRRPVRTAHRTCTPRVDLYANDDAVLLKADLPGVVAEGLAVEVDRGVLRIDGKRSEKVHYRRSLRVPDGIDPDGITATLADGVLTLMLPRVEAHKPRRIPVG